ncbi:MAG: 3-oxoacyl-[acyl-carrier-protein] reductase [Bdellovibrionales bacterium CG10_big_fil_rev_8_21_14_0_10_45_34]|nr:MAG: 3-oxoacyl-[acyl-carrier-protein] reductase [Bdellovibrionales bacterium CG10_big_fil_rev_8_21_14_0_10_45_34]
MKLSGKKIIVTGGSRGIGEGIVRALAQAGARVAFTYSASEERANKIFEALPGEGHVLTRCDVSDLSSINQAFDHMISKLEGVDGLVNNAGIARDQLFIRMKDEEITDVLNTNLLGAMRTTQKVLKPMMKARSGSIIFISSIIGHTGNAGQANYAASKAGMVAFSKSIAQEMASRNIRSNCIAPGYIETEMTEALTEDQQQKALEGVPLKRMGTTEDIAKSVEFLLSDDSSYITGQTLHVNGGLSMI